MKRKASNATADSLSELSSQNPFSARHDTNTNTPVTSPANSRNSETGSQGWGWDCNTMPTVAIPTAPTAAAKAVETQQPPLKKQHLSPVPQIKPAAKPSPLSKSSTKEKPAQPVHPAAPVPQNPLFAHPSFGGLTAAPAPMDMDAFFASRPRIPRQQSVEESYKRQVEHFPNPGIMFPMPALEFDFRISVKLNPELSRAENRVHKEIITVASGSWSGSFGNGRILAGGYDLGQARGYRPIRIVEGAFVLQTSDQVPAIFEMRTRGSLSGPANILDSLLSPQSPKEIDPRQYSFRMFSTVKAADRRYAEIVNCGLWVACGVWKADELIIDAFRVT